MPEDPIQSPSQGGCQAAAGLTGEVAAALGAREQHGRGAVPGAAAAVNRQGNRQTPSGSEGKGKEKLQTKHKADQLNPGRY